MFSLSAFDLTPSNAKAEWIVANGIGGYSSSTAIGMNTRKYHGLLVASLPKERMVLLSKLEETVKAGQEEFHLSTNQYPGKIYPEGFKQQISFHFLHHPYFTFSIEGAKLAKSVRMVHGKNTSVISYRFEGKGELELSLRPLIAMRNIHHDPSTHDKSMDFEYDKKGFSISHPANLEITCSKGFFSASPDNYRDMVYQEESNRGYPFLETLFSPGVFFAKLHGEEELHIAASVEGLSPSEALDLLDRQEARRWHLIRSYQEANNLDLTDFSQALLQAADSFVNKSRNRHWISAGFHWFCEWGRDTMISLPGLLLCTGRHALAREILQDYASKVRDGLIPNFITESGEEIYTSSDASLWYLNAIREYIDWTGDYKFVEKRLWKSIRAVISGYMHGNELARMDGDCLIRVLSPTSTWMDAQIAGSPVTPRKGKPVEINALWHSSLWMVKGLAERFGDRRTVSVVSPLIEASFESFQKFLSVRESQLFDVIEPNDLSMRPNQIFAVSLPNSPLNPIQKRHIFNLVRAKLYTPFGLRSLSPEDKHYHSTYKGDQKQRDEAYHQGMIWPWLLGAFYDAQLAVYPGSESQVLSSLRPIWNSMKRGLGCALSIPELYEPSTLTPAGAISQAWSVAEILRIYTKIKRAKSQPIVDKMPIRYLGVKAV